MGLVIGGLTLKRWQGRSTGDIAQLGEQRLDDGLTIGLNEANTTHGASEELTTFELNHGLATQPCTFDVHKLAAVRRRPATVTRCPSSKVGSKSRGSGG